MSTRRAGTLAAALGGVAALLALLAGPAGAEPSSQTSGGAVAANGSVASGDATAINGSTASGDATAINGSTASGCSTAVNLSTASGGECEEAEEAKAEGEGATPATGGAAISGASGPARPPVRLAFTGSSTAALAAAAGLALTLGTLLVAATSGRRHASSTG